MSWACAILKQARRRIIFQSRDTPGEKGNISFPRPPPQAPGIRGVSSFCITKGFLFLCNMASYFFPLKFSFISSCGSVWGFSEFHWCFCRWLLSTGLWCCCGLPQTSVGTDTGRAEPAPREGWVRGPSHPIFTLFCSFSCLFFPFFFFFCLSSALVVIICPWSSPILFCDALIMSFCHVRWLHLISPPPRSFIS